MIGALRGTLAAKQGDELVIDVNGVGYQVTVTLSVLAKAEEPGRELRLIIYTDVKENSIALYGFDSALEREVFLLLKKVKGIGSKLALAILSFMGPESLLLSIGQSDVSALQRVPGVGKKTAERVIVELREQVGETAKEIAAQNVPVIRRAGSGKAGAPVAQSGFIEDAVLALEKLGFSGERARGAVSAALEKEASLTSRADAGELLKEALAHL